MKFMIEIKEISDNTKRSIISLLVHRADQAEYPFGKNWLNMAKETADVWNMMEYLKQKINETDKIKTTKKGKKLLLLED